MTYDLEFIRQICTPPAAAESDEQFRRIEAAGRPYEYEERAGILEYDGGLSRGKAEAQAVMELRNRIDKGAEHEHA